MDISKTMRGFPLVKFEDTNGYSCSLQKSSSAMYDLIWLGCDDVPPKIMARKAKEHGIETDETTGWVDYPLPNDCLQINRMHLSRKQVFKLLPHLIKFVITGDI